MILHLICAFQIFKFKFKLPTERVITLFDNFIYNFYQVSQKKSTRLMNHKKVTTASILKLLSWIRQ